MITLITRKGAINKGTEELMCCRAQKVT
jgi:hypothetical protein